MMADDDNRYDALKQAWQDAYNQLVASQALSETTLRIVRSRIREAETYLPKWDVLARKQDPNPIAPAVSGLTRATHRLRDTATPGLLASWLASQPEHLRLRLDDWTRQS